MATNWTRRLTGGARRQGDPETETGPSSVDEGIGDVGPCVCDTGMEDERKKGERERERKREREREREKGSGDGVISGIEY